MKTTKLRFVLPLVAVLFFSSCEKEEVSLNNEDDVKSLIEAPALVKDFFHSSTSAESIEVRRFCQGTDASIWFSPDTGEYGLVTNTGVYEISRTEAQSWCQENGVI